MKRGAPLCWVGVSTRTGLVERARASAPLFEGDPLAVEVFAGDARRANQVAVRRCLELLAPAVGPTYAAVDLLLVFAGAFASAWAHRLVDAVVDEARRVRPTDSTNMETSEPIRAALAGLDLGRPRSAVVLASAYDPALVGALSAGSESVVVLCLGLQGTEPEDCDVFAALIGSAGGAEAGDD